MSDANVVQVEDVEDKANERELSNSDYVFLCLLLFLFVGCPLGTLWRNNGFFSPSGLAVLIVFGGLGLCGAYILGRHAEAKRGKFSPGEAFAFVLGVVSAIFVYSALAPQSLKDGIDQMTQLVQPHVEKTPLAPRVKGVTIDPEDDKMDLLEIEGIDTATTVFVQMELTKGQAKNVLIQSGLHGKVWYKSKKGQSLGQDF